MEIVTTKETTLCFTVCIYPSFPKPLLIHIKLQLFFVTAQASAVRFSASSSLVLQFKESYRREQKLLESKGSSVRKRRSVSSSDESFGISFRTLKGGLVLLAQDDTDDYTMIQVHISFLVLVSLILVCV